MAHVFDQNLGSTVANPLSSQSTQVLTTGAAVASAGIIFIVAGAFGANSVTSVGGGGLTWTVNKTFPNGSVRVAIASAYAASGLASGTNITATWAGNVTDRFVGGMSFTGSQVSDTGRVDTTGGSVTGSGTTWTTDAITTGNADDVLIAVGMIDGVNTIFSEDAPWTEVHDTNDGQGDSFESVYRIVSSATSYTAGGTADSVGGSASVGAIVAYKAAAGGGPAFVPDAIHVYRQAVKTAAYW